METAPLKRFAQRARRDLLEQVAIRLELVLQLNSAARRENPAAIKQIDEQLTAIGKVQLIDKVAYTWFNRFCALRYMDVNRFNRIGVVSPAEGQVQPEILAEAKMGHMDAAMVPAPLHGTVGDLLSGRATSADPQGEAYRLLVVAACNYWHTAMPFLFERIADYTELLMPDDLLSGSSILTNVRDAMTADACQDVEVIGWLYQFYISEKKQAVFDGMKKGKKITPDNIPAATQLFTPHWIVRYLVENSLGRLWMLNHPDSKLVAQMEYYIRPEQAESDFLRIERPEDIKVCDPACGSGHMLTYAFDLLYAIYDEVGTDASEIPTKILTHNLYGIEIDERAGDLAAFALSMKARARHRRFFSNPVEPHISVLKNVSFNSDELDAYMEAVGRDLFTLDLRETLKQFEEADNFGSLIRPALISARALLPLLEARDLDGQLFLRATHDKVLKVLRQADYLTCKYQVVVANPPYMGAKGMTIRTKSFAQNNYPDAKTNLFSMFVSRIQELTASDGEIGLMTPISWMSLSSFEQFRTKLLKGTTITSFVQPEYNAFWDSAHVAICAFTLHNNRLEGYRGAYVNLAGFYGADIQPIKLLEAIKNPACGWHFLADSADFKRIDGSPIAYWVRGIENFEKPKIGSAFLSGGRNKTHDNERYIRYAWEIARANTKWVGYANGGDFRKYAGNDLFVVEWSDAARDEYAAHGGLVNKKFWGREGITWSLITSAITGFRIKCSHEQYSSGSPVIFNSNYVCDYRALGFLNSPVASYYLRAITPTVNTTVNDVFSLPFSREDFSQEFEDNVMSCVHMSQEDWNSFETAQNFAELPILKSSNKTELIEESYALARTSWERAIVRTRELEEINNGSCIDAFGLQEQLSPQIPLREVTLGRNPAYRYDGSKGTEELEALLLNETVREFISYTVGCMFGRYSLDKPGLVLANQGETLADYLRQVPQPLFVPDEDNVIPLLDGEWFNDDITERFSTFLRVTFGAAHYSENLQFIESVLGKDIRKFFLKDFYGDHVKRYKKRPIYWLFSSPKGSFNALVYMHRYRPDTVSLVLQYLRDFQEKLAGERKRQEQVSISTSASAAEKTRAVKGIDSLKKTLSELDDYERDILHPLATRQIQIDLDDGVKVNYLQFGAALKKIPGLEAKDEE